MWYAIAIVHKAWYNRGIEIKVNVWWMIQNDNRTIFDIRVGNKVIKVIHVTRRT